MTSEHDSRKIDVNELAEVASMGELTQEQQGPLLHAMEQDPSARAAYIRAVAFETMLAEEFPTRVSSQPAALPMPAGLLSTLVSWPAAAMTLVLLFALGLLGWSRHQSVPKLRAKSGVGLVTTVLAGPIATVTHVSDVPVLKGTRLSPGNFEISQGRVEITFDCGAVVGLNGPARMDLVSEYRAFLNQGEICVSVPPQAVGFVILTPTSYVLDLGTAYAMQVAKNGETDLHVVEGLVEATALGTPNAKPEILSETHAARFLKNAVEPLEYDDKLFIAPHVGDATAFDRDVVHWSFDEQQGGTNDASGNYRLRLHRMTESGELPLAAPGVFGNGLRFAGKGGYAESSYSGIAGNRARTVAFWLRVSSPSRRDGRPSIVSWGLPEPTGKWEVGLNQMGLQGQAGALRVDFGSGYLIGATDLADGRWHHVAAVFHGGSNADVSTHLKLYVDGRLEMTTGRRQQSIVTETNEPSSVPLTLGRFIDVRSKRMEAYFVGEIDELYIAGGAITPDEVVRLMKVNSL